MKTILVLFVTLVTAACGERQTTAERFVKLLHSTNQYPVCSADGCIKDITAKDNTVIAVYELPQLAKDFPESAFVNRAETAATLKVGALRDFCGGLQKDFPDETMQWAGHYYTKDQRFLASVLMKVSECKAGATATTS